MSGEIIRYEAMAKGLYSDVGFVYLIENVDQPNIVKIGWAKNPAIRIRTLRTGNASAIALAAFVPGTRHDESALHKQFHTLRSRGEWFNDSESHIRDSFKKMEASWGR